MAKPRGVLTQETVETEAIPVVNSGGKVSSSPTLTVRSKIEGTLFRDGVPMIGARAYAYYAGENDMIDSSVVGPDGSWSIDDLPRTGLYDVRFIGRGASLDDWLYDVQAFVNEETDDTPPDGTAIGGAIGLES